MMFLLAFLAAVAAILAMALLCFFFGAGLAFGAARAAIRYAATLNDDGAEP